MDLSVGFEGWICSVGSGVLDLECRSRVLDLECSIWSAGSGVLDLECSIWNAGSGVSERED